MGQIYAFTTLFTLHLVKPIVGEWKSCRHKERFIEVILCRLRIGHTHLTHNFLLKKEDMPQCEKCIQPLTVMYILITCPHTETERRKHFGVFYKRRIPMHPRLILGEDPLVPLCNVINFLKESGFLDKL
uniref:Tick transposon n=1 Tax=Rhipicephalus appendiculatus TaxID=34631 RepID=A0A131YN93_RHIAP